MSAKRTSPRVVPDVDAEPPAAAPVTLSLRQVAGALVDRGPRLAAARLVRLAERGRSVEENYRRRADDLVRHAAFATVRSPALDEVVDEVATRLAGPVVDAQLPLVLCS